MNEFGGPTRKALFVLGEALSDLTRLDVGVCNMGNKFLAADGKTETDTVSELHTTSIFGSFELKCQRN